MNLRHAALLLALIASTNAVARKPCDELKSEIDARIRANGVPAFTLDVVDIEAVTASGGKIVGQCDGGSKRIVYLRGEPTTAALAQVSK